MKIALIHGIGNAHPGWSSRWEAALTLRVPQTDVIELSYEHLLENNWFNKITSTAAKLAAGYYVPGGSKLAGTITDYANDIFVYLNPWVKSTRKKIINTIENRLLEHNVDVIIGHSLGSIVAYEVLQNTKILNPDIKLITIGSPLGGPLALPVKNCLHIPNKSVLSLKGKVKSWVNIYSHADPLSGRLAKEYGVDFDDATVTKHRDVGKYLTAVSKYL